MNTNTRPVITEFNNIKFCTSADYNSVFRKTDGFSARWGKTQADNPDWCPFGPEILDIEISSVSEEDCEKTIKQCSPGLFFTDKGCNGIGCQSSICYKKNKQGRSVHMSLNLFRQIMDRFISYVDVYDTRGNQYRLYPDSIFMDAAKHGVQLCDLTAGMCIFSPAFDTEGYGKHYYSIDIKSVERKYFLQQIAFGILGVDSNPHMWNMFDEAKSRGIISNLTINGVGITDDVARKLSEKCGAVAVSVNAKNKEMAYDAIALLSQKYQMNQTNIHVVLGEESVPFVQNVVDDMVNDVRLSKMNALVMLSFKDKANTGYMSPVTLSSYSKVVNYCDSKGISYGFDSCSAWSYLKSISNKTTEEQQKLGSCVDSCCVGAWSSYINVFGEYFPCSFIEGIKELGWETGMKVPSYNNILDIWLSGRVREIRESSIACRLQQKNPCLYSIGT